MRVRVACLGQVHKGIEFSILFDNPTWELGFHRILYKIDFLKFEAAVGSYLAMEIIYLWLYTLNRLVFIEILLKSS